MLRKILLLIFDYYYYYYCYYHIAESGRMFGLVYSPWERVTTSYHFEKVVCASYERWWFKRDFNYILGSLSNYDGDGYENVT